MSSLPGSGRRALLWAARLGACGCLAVNALAVFLPAPSAMGTPSSQAAVRGVWGAGARAGSAIGRFIPDFLDPLVDDKLIHFAIFFGLALTWGGARALQHRWDRRSAALGALVLAIYAGVGELLQHALGRYGEWGDWFANLLGIAAGVVAVFSAHRIWDSVRGGRHPAVADNGSLNGCRVAPSHESLGG